MKTIKQFFFIIPLLFSMVTLHGMEKEEQKKDHRKSYGSQLVPWTEALHQPQPPPSSSSASSSSQSSSSSSANAPRRIAHFAPANPKQLQFRPKPRELKRAQSAIFFKKKKKGKEKKEKKPPKPVQLRRLGKQKSSQTQSHGLLPTLQQPTKPRALPQQTTTTRPRSTSLPQPQKKSILTTLSKAEKALFPIIQACDVTTFEKKKKRLTTFTFQDPKTGNTPLVAAALTIRDHVHQIAVLEQKRKAASVILLKMVSDATRPHDRETKNKNGETVFSVLDDVESEQELLKQVMQLSALTSAQASLDKQKT